MVAIERNEESCGAMEFQTRQAREYAQELVRTNQILRETVEKKTAFLEAAAHDLKNSFFGIQALSEIIVENEALSPAGERKVGLIRQSAADALEFIDDLLHSAADVRETRSDVSVINIDRLVQWVVRGFQPLADRKRQRLRYTVTGSEPCFVEGDWHRLREAVSNLVSNALKYSPPEKEIDVLVERCGDEVRIAVEDDGPGLSDEDQARMFAPFQRLTPDPTGGESASGLGLYLVKQVVDLHEGRVDVDSRLGEGSTFAIVLPVLPSRDAPQSGRTERDASSAVDSSVQSE